MINYFATENRMGKCRVLESLLIFLDSSSSELLIWYNKDHIKSNSESGVGKVNMYGLTLVVELKSSTLFLLSGSYIGSM